MAALAVLYALFRVLSYENLHVLRLYHQCAGCQRRRPVQTVCVRADLLFSLRRHDPFQRVHPLGIPDRERLSAGPTEPGAVCLFHLLSGFRPDRNHAAPFQAETPRNCRACIHSAYPDCRKYTPGAHAAFPGDEHLHPDDHPGDFPFLPESGSVPDRPGVCLQPFCVQCAAAGVETEE